MFAVDPTPATTSPPEAKHHYHFDVKMTCTGCSGAVERVLKKMDGLKSYTVSLPTQTADVWTDEVGYEAVLERIRKTGKEVRGGERDGVVVEV